MIKTADWIIDLGPKAATAAARKPALGLDPRVAAGTPEDVVKEKCSYTGQYLKPVLAKGGPKRRKVEAAE